MYVVGRATFLNGFGNKHLVLGAHLPGKSTGWDDFFTSWPCPAFGGRFSSGAPVFVSFGQASLGYIAWESWNGIWRIVARETSAKAMSRASNFWASNAHWHSRACVQDMIGRRLHGL